LQKPIFSKFTIITLFCELTYVTNTRRIRSRFPVSPALATTGKVSAAEVTNRFFHIKLRPTFHFYGTVLTETF